MPQFEALAIRLILFPTIGHISPVPVWQDLFGVPPESSESRPREGSLRETGSFARGFAEVLSHPGRVQASYTAMPTQAGQLQLLPQGFEVAANLSLGETAAVLDEFAPTIRTYLRSVALPVTRLAMITTNILASGSSIEALKEIDRLCPGLTINAERTTDFLYRINHRAASDCVEYYNRLTTFQVLNVEWGVGSSIGRGPVFRTQDYVQMELDINSPAENPTPLPNDVLVTIFEDLVRLTRENLDRGEVI